MNMVQLPLWPAPPEPDSFAEIRRVLRYSGYRSLSAWQERHRPRRLGPDGEWRDVPFAETFPAGDVLRGVRE